MASYNKVILMGHLTRDPEIKYLPSQTPVCDFSLAVNRKWKDASGGEREEVLFIDCAAFGKTGELIGENLAKGRPIHVEGRLRLEQWEQEDGQRRSKIRVVVEQFRFVDRKPKSAPPAQRSGRGKRPNGNNRRGARDGTRGGKPTPPAQPDAPTLMPVGGGDDIPF